MVIAHLYGEHVVAFVDVLGFRDLVGRMDRDPSLIDRVYNVLAHIADDQVSQDFGAWVREGLANVTVVSDSVFYSVSLTGWTESGPRRSVAWACLAAIESVFWLQRYLLKLGVLTRGGLAVGPLLHHDNVIFGPALVRAYDLEQIALFPRVLVDQPVLDLVHSPSGHDPNWLPSRLESLIKRDVDGLPFIDYLHYDSMSIENPTRLTDLFVEVHRVIEAALSEARPDLRVFQKVAWLALYFNDSLHRLCAKSEAYLGDFVDDIDPGPL